MQFRKRKTREIAMQILFAWDSQSNADAVVATQVAAIGTDEVETRAAAIEIARATWEQLAILDAWIERLAPKWPPRRQPGVDRSLLRLAAWELTSRTAPPGVVIDEAIALAKLFSTQQSASFVNGVLDAMRKEHDALTRGEPGTSGEPILPAAETAPADDLPGSAPQAAAPESPQSKEVE